eukprot:1125741-Rhodomonas_salina.1
MSEFLPDDRAPPAGSGFLAAPSHFKSLSLIIKFKFNIRQAGTVEGGIGMMIQSYRPHHDAMMVTGPAP